MFFNFLIVNRDHTESELVDLSQDDLTMALMSLVYKKRLGVVAERFECDDELKVGSLHLDVYLNEAVKANFTTSADPSENMRFQMAEEMHLVMANVCLSHASHKNYCTYFFVFNFFEAWIFINEKKRSIFLFKKITFFGLLFLLKKLN